MFEIIKQSKKSKARLGRLKTKNGVIETPVFMPVGTQASVKGVLPDQLKALGSQIVLANTYHLHLRPTDELIQKQGGLHAFMNWDLPILTDSGGYQVFSLGSRRKIDPEGVTFASHIDGRRVRFTPKVVIDIQRHLGSDIMMPLDICSAYPCEPKQLRAEMQQSMRWELEALEYWQQNKQGQMLFSIVQGGCDHSLREESVDALIEHPFSGFAIGGLSVGEPQDLLESTCDFVANKLPEDKPRYLMGVGLPKNMKSAICSGIDMFDCVAPTRLARHGSVFSEEGHLCLKNARFKEDPRPIEASCDCLCCRSYSRAYLRHLLVAKEPLAITLLSIHNIKFMHDVISKIKKDILEDRL